MNPDDFVITRKRKRYKFAKFYNAENCFELADWSKRPVDVIEIGAGTGLFSVALAENNPDKTFAAIDVKADRLQKGAYEALSRGLSNVFFIRARADQLDQALAQVSLDSIWLTFPDPFPKDRSASRRLTHRNFLELYKQLLKPKGSLYLKHDNLEFFDWSLGQITSGGWRVEQLSYDLHKSDLNQDYKITTTYEKRWIGQGQTIKFLHAIRD